MSSIPKSRKTLLLQTTSGTDNFKVVETEVPAVNKLDVVIHVKFCGLNFAECSMKQVSVTWSRLCCVRVVSAKYKPRKSVDIDCAFFLVDPFHPPSPVTSI